MWLYLVLCALGLLVFMFYQKRSQKMQLFRQLNIPGPQPNWILGNFGSFFSSQISAKLHEWGKQYGKTFGYFEGPMPILVTSDPDILEEVFIKRFSNFHGRKLFPMSPQPDDPECDMFKARGNRWKRLRAVTVPSFSAAKIKLMSTSMQQSVDTFMEKIEAAAVQGEDHELVQDFQTLALDVIARCAFGLDLDSQHNDNDILASCRKAFVQATKLTFSMFLAILTPDWADFWWWYYKFTSTYIFSEPFLYLFHRMDDIINLRKSDPDGHKHADLLTLMLNAEVDESKIPHDLETKRETGSTISAGSRTLTADEAKMQGIIFFVAGYDTTSTTLSYICYHLSTHPEVQERLYKEVRDVVGDNKPTYDDISKLTYLDQVIKESQRIYPLGNLALARVAMHDVTIGKLHIPKDTVVQADAWTLHRDPEIWGPDPETFDPDRFSAENVAQRHPMAFMPFGAGPRNCVGMRFALTSMKLTLTSLVQRFRLERCAKTEVPLQLKEQFTISPKNGVYVKVTHRT